MKVIKSEDEAERVSLVRVKELAGEEGMVTKKGKKRGSRKKTKKHKEKDQINQQVAEGQEEGDESGTVLVVTKPLKRRREGTHDHNCTVLSRDAIDQRHMGEFRVTASINL